MGLINREMASRGGGPFWKYLSDWKCFGINFLDTIRSPEKIYIELKLLKLLTVLNYYKKLNSLIVLEIFMTV